jgi:3-isopropylmalate/(R)-2-methylmalate dehydratase large subunit
MVALPGGVIDNAEPAGKLAGTRVDQAFIGSCANGQLPDLETAARLLRGRQVAPGTRLIVTPASQQVYVQASRLGYLADLAEAGAVVTNPTCGACFGYHPVTGHRRRHGDRGSRRGPPGQRVDQRGR